MHPLHALGAVTAALAILSAAPGCGGAPSLQRIGTVTIEAERPSGREYPIRGNDCTAVFAGMRARGVTVEAALRHALDEAHATPGTPVYDVEATVHEGPETCVEVRGVVVVRSP